jgi:5-formyltetrahydrofolate cyclo-ligase
MASEDLPANGHGGPADPKPVLRRERRAARRAYVAGLGPEERDGLETALADHLAASLPPGLVAGYDAMGSEIGLHRVARAFLLPRVVDGGPLTFHAGPDGPAVTPDIALVPLLAVDRRGTRLGQGGGHYDRTLAALRATRPVLAVGVAWDMQIVDHLPADPWDAPLDALATPSGWRDFRGG